MEDKIFRKIVDNLTEGVYFVDPERQITYWNKEAERITGYSQEDVRGSYCFDNILNHIDEDGRRLCLQGCPLHATIKDGNVRKAKVYLHHKKGHRVAVEITAIQITKDNQVIGAVELFTDRLNDPSNQAATYQRMALYDDLTNLANRRYFDDYLQMKIQEFQRYQIPLIGFFIDIDHFKNVNDLYGHSTGDEVLKMVAYTLEAGLRKGDFVARYGGEEFFVLLTDLEDSQAQRIGDKLRMLAEHASVRVSGKEIHVTVSIGGAKLRKGETGHSFIKRCDQLMYQSKQAGRNKFIYDAQ